MLHNFKHYMNPVTGSVDLGFQWLESFKDDAEYFQCDWQEWGGDTLIEVEKINGNWVEVK